MSKVVWKPGTLLAPVPAVMVSCGTMEKSNIITIAWTGIVNSDPAMTYISVRPSRYSYDLIRESGEFVINLTNDKLIRATDLCGVKSGRDGDKFQLAKLTKEPASQLACPMIAESPISLECRVKQVLPLGSHDMFLAEIVAVNVDESLLDEKGKLHLSRAGLMSYSHGEYFGQGRRLGSFGCSVRKKTPPKKTNKRK
ncbi:MAG: flavin reductase family protein [Oscillospiraceae bacterium]|nr:flavin reductase family protein [Oscillospiraceae bacterium]